MARRWLSKLLLLTLLGLASGGALAAGDERPVGVITEVGPDGHATQQLLPEGAIGIRAVSRNGTIAQQAFFPNRALDVIVQFDAAPTALARARRADVESSRSPYRSFLSDLPALEAA